MIGGWWRLWIVLSVLYASVAVVVEARYWPSIARTPHDPSLEYELSDESRRLLRARSPSLNDLFDSLRRADRAGDVELARSVARRIRRAQVEPWTLDPVVIRAANGYIFHLPATSTKSEVAAFSADYHRALAADVADRSRDSLIRLMLVAIAPPLGVLLLALAFAWIRQGFRGSAARNGWT